MVRLAKKYMRLGPLIVCWKPTDTLGFSLNVLGWYVGFLPFHPRFNAFGLYRVPRCHRCGKYTYQSRLLRPDGPIHWNCRTVGD